MIICTYLACLNHIRDDSLIDGRIVELVQKLKHHKTNV